MTAAMLHASCLSEYLAASRPTPFRPLLLRRRTGLVDAAWQVSTMADLALPHVDGPYPRGYPAIRWASGLVFKASLKDQAVNRRLNQVTMMLAHPSSLAWPGVRCVRHAGARP